jgi:glutaminyl-peptide cyclotransferase
LRKTLAGALAATLMLAVSLAASVSPAFDSNRAYQHLRQIVAFGPRPAGSPALDATRRYLREQLAAAGVPCADQAFDASTPIGQVKMTNIIATIPGGNPERRIVFGGHYDTKLFPQFPFVGANDAGSSSAFLLELARVLKARKNPLTLEIVFLDGEEAFGEWDTGNTFGSRHYVEAARKVGTIKRIGAFILVDMIGGRDLVLEREGNSTPWLMDAMLQAASRLKLEQTFAPQRSPIEDDHLPFLQAGIPSVDLIGFTHYQAYWHTRDDTLDKVSARSLQTVGDIILGALPQIETRLAKGSAPVSGKKAAPKKPTTNR